MPRLVDTPLGPFWTHDQGTITRALVDEHKWWDAHLKPLLDEVSGGWALDLGAHIGWFTLYLAGRHDHVVAVEPHPASFQLLATNVSKYGWIERWPVAAYSHPILLQADANDAVDRGAVGFLPAGAPADALAVVGLPLDGYLPEDAPVRLIKCDCQGADLRALTGLARTLARCRPLIVLEWEASMAHAHGDTWEDALAWFAGLRYSVTRITGDYWDYVARPL